jgi:hypothetical protein
MGAMGSSYEFEYSSDVIHYSIMLYNMIRPIFVAGEVTRAGWI